MICPNCEKEIAGNVAQCPHCGCHFPVKEQPKQELIKETSVIKESPSPQTKTEISSAPKSEPTVIKEQVKPLPTPSVVKEETDFKMNLESISPESVKQQESGDIAESGNTCPNCKKTNKNTAAFCKWCGSRIAKETIEIKEIKSNAKFCKHCGKSITATSSFCKYCGLRC